MVDGLKALWRLHGGGRLASSFVGAGQAYQKREARLRGCRRRWLSLLFFVVAREGKGAASRDFARGVTSCPVCVVPDACCLSRNPNSVSGR